MEPVYSDSYLEFDRDAIVLKVRGVKIEITPIEWRLLDALISHSGKVVAREAMAVWIWGNNWRDDDSVKWHISNLRRKLEQASAPSPIQTIHGFGYKYEVEQ